MLQEVNMATVECNLEQNLSDNLSPEKNENELPSPEENEFVLGNQNVTSNKTDRVCLSDETDNVKLDDNKGTLESEACEMKNETINESCIGKQKDEMMKNSETVELPAQLKSSEMPGRVKVDEALNEENEMGGESSDEEEHYESAEEQLTPEKSEERMKEALELKNEGNDHFRKQEYVDGKDLYSRAIRKCPKEFTENKSVFYSNRAACSQKMEDYESAINDCSKALELSPKYLKARLRRAQCYEKVEKLEEALEDYKIVFETDRSCQPAREAIMRLPEEIKVKHEKLKEEMIGKLKDLGNMVLRPFGLSTDNFKLQQDPNSGGYSINFQK